MENVKTKEKITYRLQNITLVKKQLIKKKRRKHSAIEVSKLLIVTMLENRENFVKYLFSRTCLPKIGFCFLTGKIYNIEIAHDCLALWLTGALRLLRQAWSIIAK